MNATLNTTSTPLQRYRTIFLSDIHLGTKGCKTDFLLDFLRSTDADTLYLVGDIIDGWQLKKGWYWPQSHNDVIQKLLRKARKGTAIIYIPGNHDEFARAYTETENDFGAVKLLREGEHHTADGKRLLITHGDAYDGIILYAKWLARLGDHAYTLALWVNHWFNVVRRQMKLPYWSLSKVLKHKVKNAAAFIAKFEGTMLEEARRRGFDGVICGHLHHPEIREVNGTLYCNSGDWVESCSAVVEHFDGRLDILDWTRQYDHGQMNLWQDDKDIIPQTSQPFPLETTRFQKGRTCVFSWLQMLGFRKSTVLSQPSALLKSDSKSAGTTSSS